jgi:hypothetical protein
VEGGNGLIGLAVGIRGGYLVAFGYFRKAKLRGINQQVRLL